MQTMTSHTLHIPTNTAGVRCELAGRSLLAVDLPAVLGAAQQRMPVVLQLLAENVARNSEGAARDAALAAIIGWLDAGTSDAEIPFQPSRILMHDTTSTPALVDIAAMRDALAEAGVDPSALNPMLPVDVSVDHSLAVEAFATRDASTINLQHELRRNGERYRFLRWASRALSGVRIHPPGTGIMHTINLEQLATVVTTETRGGDAWAVPDTMLGTDSHTPMINGIGVLGWGVGGLEAQTVMFGMPTMLRIPDVIGVRLTGRLTGGSTSTDLALTVTKALREFDAAGAFVEFFGPGVSKLSAGDRAVVANMAPENGATTGYFPIDASTVAYLAATGRTAAQCALVEAYARHTGLWFDPAAERRYTKTITIALDAIGMHVAGPRRPQDLLALSDVPRVLAAMSTDSASELPSATAAMSTTSKARPAAQAHSSEIPEFPIAIAAITSCTNTSDPRLLIAAGLVARNARRRGLRVAPWIKTSLAPGSPAALSYLRRAGLLDDLAALGFDIVGYGCTTCIGNSGPLTPAVRAALDAGQCKPVAALSGNRNFPGRVHPDLDLGFIMSPPLVVAYALAADATRNLQDEPLQVGADGAAVHLADLWPANGEIDACVAAATDATDFARDFAGASRQPAWDALTAPTEARFPWDAGSTALRRPPFASLDAGSQLGRYVAQPLLVVGDDITTDHISPASAIPQDSLVADFLVTRGDDRRDLNVFASRRGNWEVMLRAAFHNKNLVNLLAPDAPVAHTLHVPSKETVPLWIAAERYRDAGQAVVIVAGDRYGMGSSRDWAAKGVRLLGVRAVLATSFERIHRSNLIGMGVLPLRLPPGAHPKSLRLAPGDRIEVDAVEASLGPRAPVKVRILRANGDIDAVTAVAAVETALEVELLRHGGVIPLILSRTLAAHPARQPDASA
jgi:aconitate hydratase